MHLLRGKRALWFLCIVFSKGRFLSATEMFAVRPPSVAPFPFAFDPRPAGVGSARRAVPGAAAARADGAEGGGDRLPQGPALDGPET